MDKIYIERTARDIQARIWRQRAVLWPGKEPGLIDMLDPAIAAGILGVRFEQYEELGRFGYDRDRFEIAGSMNRQTRNIAVSMRFSPEVIRFTAAHELGHWLLHPSKVMHRDRPITDFADAAFCHEPQEREANYFAACFLMPRKLLTSTLESTFSIQAPFIINDDAAYWLRPDEPDSLFEGGPLERAAAVASARSYGGRPIQPLMKQFRVSIKAMAIQLVEVGLVR